MRQIKKTFSSEFQVDLTKGEKIESVNDYEIFDKILREQDLYQGCYYN